MAQKIKQPRQLRIHILQRGGLRLHGIHLSAVNVHAVRLMQRGHVDEEKNSLVRRSSLNCLNGNIHLVASRLTLCNTQLFRPETLMEQAREDSSKRCQAVEEPDSSNTECVVSPVCKGRHNIRFVKHPCFFRCRFAAREPCCVKSRMWTGCRRGRQKAREERMMSRVGEAPWRMSKLPAAGNQSLQVGRPALLHRHLSHIPAERVQSHEQDVRFADDGFHC